MWCTCVFASEASATASIFFVVSFIYVNNIFTKVLLTLHRNDAPYNLIYNYMDINLTIETSTTSGLVSIDPGFVEK